jgi:flagellar protein FlaG
VIFVKVQGVDPTILNRIQEKVRQKAVQGSEQVIITDNRRRRSRQQKREQGHNAELMAESLNEIGEDLDIDLVFAAEGEGTAVVLVLEKSSGKVVSRLPAERARALLGELRNYTGLMVDYYL